MGRNWLPPFFLLLTFALFGTFTYFSRFPDSPALIRAQEWPWVGDAIQQFRQGYTSAADTGTEPAPEPDPVAETEKTARPSGKAPEPAPRAKVEQPAQPQPYALVGAVEPAKAEPPADIELESPDPWAALEWRWLIPGRPLSEAPQSAAATHLAALARLPVLDRQGSWLEVVYGGKHFWTDSRWQPDIAREGTGQGPARRKRQPPVDVDSYRLGEAKKLLGTDGPRRKVGPYDLYTDVQDEALLDELSRVAEIVPKAYTARYGRSPSGNPERAIFLFRREEDYRGFARGANFPGGKGRGFTGKGYVAFYAGDNPGKRNDLIGVFVHEMTHLLNDRSLAWQLPGWLDEGIPVDLGSVWLEKDDAESLENPSFVLDLDEFQAGIRALKGAIRSGKLPPVETLIRLDRDGFYTNYRWSYSYSGAFVRFLSEAQNGRYADGFRRFLKGIADGRDPDPETLPTTVGSDFPTLDRDFAQWIDAENEKIRKQIEEHATQLYRRRHRP